MQSNYQWGNVGDLNYSEEPMGYALAQTQAQFSNSPLNRELAVSVYTPSQLTAPLASAPVSPSVSTWSSIPLRYKKQYISYYFQTPLQKYQEIMTELGPPTLLNQQSGGLAIWQHPGGEYHVFDRIDILDEQCFNRFPYPHIGFLYTYLKIKIPLSQLSRVLSLCGDIMYDPIKKYLVVRGMSLGYNVALSALVAQYVRGQLSWYQILDNDLIHQVTHHKNLTNPRKQKRNLRLLKN